MSKFLFAFKGSSQSIKAALQPLSNNKSQVAQTVRDTIDERFKEPENTPIAISTKDKKNLDYYEMILFWDSNYWPEHSFKYQRLGFRAPGTILEACTEAQRLAELMAHVATKQGKIRGKPVEVLAVYRRGSFQDWQQETKHVYGGQNDFIKETLDIVRQDKLKNVKVSKGGFTIDTSKMKMVR